MKKRKKRKKNKPRLRIDSVVCYLDPLIRDESFTGITECKKKEILKYYKQKDYYTTGYYNNLSKMRNGIIESGNTTKEIREYVLKYRNRVNEIDFKIISAEYKLEYCKKYNSCLTKFYSVIPQELYLEILQFLYIPDILCFMLAKKEFYEVVRNSNWFWGRILNRYSNMKITQSYIKYELEKDNKKSNYEIVKCVEEEYLKPNEITYNFYQDMIKVFPQHDINKIDSYRKKKFKRLYINKGLDIEDIESNKKILDEFYKNKLRTIRRKNNKEGLYGGSKKKYVIGKRTKIKYYGCEKLKKLEKELIKKRKLRPNKDSKLIFTAIFTPTFTPTFANVYKL